MFIFNLLLNWQLSAPNYFAYLQIVGCFTSIWVSRLLFIGRGKNYKAEGILSLIFFCWKTWQTEKVSLVRIFQVNIKNFEHQLLSPQKSKWKDFSAHQKENFLSFLKLTLLFFLVPFLWELWPVKTWGRFFWDTLYIQARINIDKPGSKKTVQLTLSLQR